MVRRHVDQIRATGEEENNDVRYRLTILTANEPEKTFSNIDTVSTKPYTISDDNSKKMQPSLLAAHLPQLKHLLPKIEFNQDDEVEFANHQKDCAAN